MSENPVKCVAVPNKKCKNRLLRESCKTEKIPLCIIAEPVIQVLDNGVLKAGSVDGRLHSAGFQIRILETTDSHYLAEIVESHGEFKKGDKVRVLKEHVEEQQK